LFASNKATQICLVLYCEPSAVHLSGNVRAFLAHIRSEWKTAGRRGFKLRLLRRFKHGRGLANSLAKCFQLKGIMI